MIQKISMNRLVILCITVVIILPVYLLSAEKVQSPREHLLMDFGWRFALGHAWDQEKDFKHGTDYFSQFAKTGRALEGPSSVNFDDRSWRLIDLPHDWAVELPFDSTGNHSHGYKAIGSRFPENSVGWYRKSFFIDQADSGKLVSLQFDGVFRHSEVYVNGFYCGLEESGYTEFSYDITDYLNYGGDNIVVVRVDATKEEGWFYEGAGIYRHVWLNKTNPLHIVPYGVYVTTRTDANVATLRIQTTVVNQSEEIYQIHVQYEIKDCQGQIVAETRLPGSRLVVPLGEENNVWDLTVENPDFWSPENPVLYQLITTLSWEGKVIDQMTTPFGIRTIDFDPDQGFFLNGEHVEIKGTNNHLDHAGVGTAVPDALNEFRIKQLKAMGSNAIRCSHNPPSREFLDTCDRLGMLVLDENRLMGCNDYHFDQLKAMILRDRNHPSVIAWSLGNEEWAIEGNAFGERIAERMQFVARQWDSTRPYTVASSGGWGQGVSVPIELMGFNYISHGSTDAYHKQFPNKPGWGTEESTISATRGIYTNDRTHGHLAPRFRKDGGSPMETGWRYYAERPYLAGLFYWTGFDYRGEPNPLVYPAVSSQFGILDLCGFPKDSYYYLQSWWTDEPILHLSPHWNWQGKEGEIIPVRVYSSCDEVALSLNGKSLGKKAMVKNSHLDWEVPFAPGTLLAEGYSNGKKIIATRMETTNEASKIQLTADKMTLIANSQDVSIITVQVQDRQGRFVPDANQTVAFSINGPGKIIGVGNGDPGSHEPDQFFDHYRYSPIMDMKYALFDRSCLSDTISLNPENSEWKPYGIQNTPMVFPKDTLLAIWGSFMLDDLNSEEQITLYAKSLCEDQSVYINGARIAQHVKRDDPEQIYTVPNHLLKSGENNYMVIGPPMQKKIQWEELNTNPGLIRIITPAQCWKRNVFNGLAQVIVQSTDEPGEITLNASGDGLKTDRIILKSGIAKHK